MKSAAILLVLAASASGLKLSRKADADVSSTSTSCDLLDLPTDTQWAALKTNMVLTPSNYCRQTKGNGWYCHTDGGSSKDVCVDMTTADAGGCALYKETNAKEDCATVYGANAVTGLEIKECETGGKATADGWWWNMISGYDISFGCDALAKWAKCKGPYPSFTCPGPHEFCWSGECIDVVRDRRVCDYAGDTAKGKTKGTPTDDGWDFDDLGYTWGTGCFINRAGNPDLVTKSLINLANGENADTGRLADDFSDMLEPVRESFMGQAYNGRYTKGEISGANAEHGWRGNLKMKTGFQIDLTKISTEGGGSSVRYRRADAGS